MEVVLADSGFVGIDPAELSRADAHRLLLHCVAPRPIAFTSTLSESGVPNLAPFSYFMAGGGDPPPALVSPPAEPGGEAQGTPRNIPGAAGGDVNEDLLLDGGEGDNAVDGGACWGG